MRWRQRRRSANIEDRRRVKTGGLLAGGGLGAVVIVLLIMFLGGDPSALLTEMGSTPQSPVQQREFSPAEDELAAFISVVLADTEDVWHQLFQRMGGTYREPKLVLFSGQVRSACGFASAAVGPFYCPADQRVYIDLGFYEDLKARFQAPGDFAQAYVIAHEIGHHVQNLLGISAKMQAMKERLSDAEYNRLSVKLELQADFFAGVWAHHAEKSKHILEDGDIEEALAAASAIGDDRLQKQAQGYVVPDSFTHGTSAQRARWFRRGLKTGDLSQGDTFNADEL